MESTFQNWLFSQLDRQDEIGLLARAMAKADFSFSNTNRRWDEHKAWASIVTRQGKPEHIPAFNLAWHEYKIMKQKMEPAE